MTQRADNMVFTQGCGFVLGVSLGLPCRSLRPRVLVCHAADTASLATWQSFGKLFCVVTLLGFGEKRCRKNLPLYAPRFSMNGELPTDPYWKLRPEAPTPPDELCGCESISTVVLCDTLGSNPLRCFDCSGEILPERVGYSADTAESIANWRSLHSSLYRLWLSSGEYENWARVQLLDPNGEMNRLGYDIVAELNSLPSIGAYYWYFVDTDAESEPTACPKCSAPLRPLPNGNRGTCDSCRIIL